MSFVALSESDTMADSDDEEDDHSIDEDAVLHQPNRDFDDVGGMDDLKAKLRERVIMPLRRPSRYEDYGLGATDGVLLHGPPGCGKTFIAGALAGELGYNYVNLTPADLSSKWLGEGTENIAKVFDVAEENQPCILFIDEIDAIASSRDDGSNMHNDRKMMVNQLLTELQNVPDGVVVVAATNYVDDIDGAILRSGRFDERIEVPPPDPVARGEILSLYLPDAKTEPNVSIDATVDVTGGYASSDIELVAELAARHAMANSEKISADHLAAAVAETSTSIADWLHRYDGLDSGESGTVVTQPESTNLPAAELQIRLPRPSTMSPDWPTGNARSSSGSSSHWRTPTSTSPSASTPSTVCSCTAHRDVTDPPSARQ
ncbi:ATP-binding protein [Halomicroarcula sp. GCM10025894]|uniref:ATP-binding protein n=1 Tax=Halomicroarcula sp. GCM10025894 TaxID=3252673 RepID=UPI003609DC8C